MKTYEEYDFKAVLAAASKTNTTTTDGSTTQSRKKRFNWDDFDDGGDDSGGSKGKNDYSKLGIGALSKQFNENMVRKICAVFLDSRNCSTSPSCRSKPLT